MRLENSIGNAVHGLPFATEHSVDLNTVAWLALVDEVVLKNDLHGARKLPWWRVLRHLLNCDNLVIFVDTVAILRTEWVLVLIFDWEL